MKKVLLPLLFFICAPIFLFISIVYFLFISHDSNYQNYLLSKSTDKIIAFTALPASQSVLGDSIIEKDARIEIVRQFFANYKSPLEPFATDVIEQADKYNIDYRLIPAIAMQESNLCKKIIANSYNCWGFGIYGKKVTRFENFPEAIETVTRTLAKNYIAGGLQTPEEIMKKYTPSSNGSWARGVTHFMDQLQ